MMLSYYLLAITFNFSLHAVDIYICIFCFVLFCLIFLSIELMNYFFRFLLSFCFCFFASDFYMHFCFVACLLVENLIP